MTDRMEHPAPTEDLTSRENALREDLAREYYSLVDLVAGFDGRLMTIKGWSVTLSLAALGLAFQQQRYALFALAALTALAFWFLDVMNKRHQMLYYSRMRDIEVAAYHLNALPLPDLGLSSAPRIDMTWGFRGKQGRTDWRTEKPARRTAAEIRLRYLQVWVMPHVLLPHVVAVVLGISLFVAAVLDAPGLAQLDP